MTDFVDEFEAISSSYWLQQSVAATGDLSIDEDTLLTTATAGAQLRRPVTSYDLSAIETVSDNPLDFDIATDTGLSAGEKMWCYLSGLNDGGSGTWTDGTYQVTALSGTRFTIQNPDGTDYDGSAGAWVLAGSVIFPTDLTSGNEGQRAGAVVHATAEASGNRAVLWSRMSRLEPAVAGYGVSLEWGASGARTLSILKLNESTGSEETLTSLSVTSRMNSVGGSDLNQSQFLSIAVTDIVDGENATESAGTLIRAWLNADADGDVALEHRDRDRLVHRDAGGFAIELGATSVYCDQWMDEIPYVSADYGEHEHNNRTLSELRSALNVRLAQGNTSNLSEALLNQTINEAIYEILGELGDNAHFLRKSRAMTLTIDGDKLVTMPYDVDRVDAIFNASSHIPSGWHLVGYDDYGRQQIYMQDQPSGRSYDVIFWQRVEPLDEDTDECCIPRRWDDVILSCAALRIAGEGERDKAHGETLYRRYRTDLGRLMKDMNRQRRGEDRKIRVRKRAYLRKPHTGRYSAPWQTRFPL